MNKVIHILFGAAVLLALSLIYFLLLPHGQATLSPSQWLLFGEGALPLVLAAFLPSIVRRFRGLPPPQVSPSDLRFTIVLIAILCPLIFLFGTLFGQFGFLLIIVVPIAFAIRAQRRSKTSPKARNA